MRYRLLCLDAGFTLLAPRRSLGEALKEFLSEHGHAATDEQLHAAWEAADRWFWDEYHRPENETWSDDERINETWRRFHGVLLGELGLGEAIPELVELILAAQFAPGTWQLFPDVPELFDALRPARAAGLRVGVVSDWNSNLRDIFRQLEVDGEIDFVLASAGVGLAKPDPAFYRLALERAGVQAAEAIMVGDSYRADVEGARAAGMDAVLLDREGEAGPADVPVIRTLIELPAIVLDGAEAGTRARRSVEADA